MKNIFIALFVLLAIILIGFGVRFVNETVAPRFLDSRLERLSEKNLPKILIQGGTVYCRMKADDFRFPLPPGSRVVSSAVTGGFDTVNGKVEVRFEGTNRIAASSYEAFLADKVQLGGRITAQTIPEGLSIEFHYFGDR